MRLMGLNATAHPREEVVLFGCDKGFGYGEILDAFEDYDIRTARVLLDGFSSGEVEEDHIDRPLIEALPGVPFIGNHLVLCSDGRRMNHIYMRNLSRNGQMTVALYRAIGGGIISNVILYISPLNDHVRYEWMPVVESLNSQDVELDIELKCYSSDHILISRIGKAAYKGSAFDMQGLAFPGVILPVSIPSEPLRMSTWFANRDFDLFCTGSWDHRWGPWDRTMMVGGTHPDRGNDKSPLAHRGLILNKRPGDTGEQGGFGYWKGLDALGPKQLHRLVHDYYAGLQAGCRPIHVFNDAGDIPRYHEYQNYRSWSETWDSRITKETFRRTYDQRGRYEGWLQEDEEHYNDEISLLYLVKTTGSYAIRRIAEMKAFHWVKQNRFPTIGRALGRNMLNGITLHKILGHEEIRREALARFVPALKATWKATNGEFDPSLEGLKKPYALRLILNDPQTHIKGFGWYVWEDAMAAAALDRISRWLNDPEIRLMALFLSRSVVQYGIEERPGGKFQIAKAIEWQGPGNLGKQVAWADQTNYLEWGAGCIGVSIDLSLAHGDTETAEKAEKIADYIRKSNYWNLDSYLANIF